VNYDAETASRYIEAVIGGLEAFARGGGPRRAADSIYFGGGTASLLSERDAARVADAAARPFFLSPQSEITLELNPETAGLAKLRGFRAAGVNRLSVGVQSLNDATLHRLGRGHTARQAERAVDLAREAGFGNISADIMLALPGEGRAGLEHTLKGISGWPINHISAYLLKISPGTPFGDNAPPDIPDDDEQAGLYKQCLAALGDMGFARYEISNFARPGYESRHNMKYWDCGEYIGLGAAAHSSLDGRRYSFPPDIGRFIEVFGGAKPPRAFLEHMRLEGEVTPQDYIMMRLRTSRGLRLGELRSRFGYSLGRRQLELIERCRRGGLMEFDGEKAALTTEGMLVSNARIAGLI
jgi:oxygen-independent coproporphyrinogen-3 oxidase